MCFPAIPQFSPCSAAIRSARSPAIHYPSSLIRPDKLGFEPRVGISWRPIPASTVVVRAGYGIYDDTSVYLTSVLQLAQQSPLSTSLSVAEQPRLPAYAGEWLSAHAPRSPPTPSPSIPTSESAMHKPGNCRSNATCLGRCSSRRLTSASRAREGCSSSCPTPTRSEQPTLVPAAHRVLSYQASGGDSTRQAGQLQLRRRLRSGFTASLLYTFSKSIDDDAFLGGQGHVLAGNQSAAPAGGQGSGQGSGGGSDKARREARPPPRKAHRRHRTIAQNWLNLHAERSLSSFDQRHLLNLQAQYTTGEGLGGGTLMGGWPGRLLKEWTIVGTAVVGTGLPDTPVYLAAVPGTGVTGTIRPDPTGAPIYAAPAGLHLNPAAYSAPLTGQWGTAGRNSITGPSQFSLDSSVARTFRPSATVFLRFEGVGNQHVESPGVYWLEHDREQHAIRSPP